MKIWALTQLGKLAARNVRNPDTIPYKIIHSLDRLKTATVDQIAIDIGEDVTSVQSALSKMSSGKYRLVGEV